MAEGAAGGSIPIGTVLEERYRIEAEIGHGGMGIVYRAIHLGLGSPRAVKLITPRYAQDPEYVDRIWREANHASHVEHPNVVAVYDFGQYDGQPYIVMQYIEGTDLERVLQHSGPLGPSRVIELLSQVAGALDAAHAGQVVHRDVKPSNILVVDRHGRETAMLTDFGLAKQLQPGSAPTMPSMWGGTVEYMPPEQFEGKGVDGRADIYSLGCVLYETLSGRSPGAGQLYKDPTPISELRPEVPSAVDAVVSKARERDPERRYATAGELMVAARSALEGHGESSSAPPMDSSPGTGPPRGMPTHGDSARRGTESMESVADQPRAKRERSLPMILAVAAVAAIAIVVLAATGVLSGGSNSGTSESSVATTASTADSAAQARSDIRRVLGAYENAYSQHDPDGLRTLFTPDVTRHGLRAGGCSETSGRDSVLRTYEEQFAAGSGRYSLTNLSADTMSVTGSSAQVSTRYSITPGSTGSVQFLLRRANGDWRISRVDASC